MSWLSAIAYRLHVALRNDRAERELDDEFAFHLEMEQRANMDRGLSSDDAAARAAQDFGDRTGIRDHLRDARSHTLAGLAQDIRFALRRVSRERAFSALIIATLAVGIGWTLAIFSVVDTALVRPLAYPAPEQLVHLWERREGTSMNKGELSPAEYRDLEAARGVFAAMAGYRQSVVSIATRGVTERANALRVTASFLPLLGIRPAIGRAFENAEDEPGAAPTALLSDDAWRTRFGGDRSIVGRVVTIDGAPTTIVGVLPPSFRFVLATGAEFLVPIQLDRSAGDRSNRWVRVIARLRPGVSVDQARRELDAAIRRMAAEFPETTAGRAGSLVPLRDEMVGGNRAVLLTLLVGVAALLLTGCANVAGLLLARVAGRASELAIRRAIGADVSRIVSQIIIENLMLAVFGGIAGIGVAYLALRVLIAQVPPALLAAFPFVATTTLDGRAVGIAVIVSVITGLLCGVVPAVAASRHAPAELLRSSSRSVVARARWRLALVTGQLALTFALVECSSLLGRSLVELMRAHLGFRVDSVLTLGVAFTGARYDSAAARALAVSAIERRLSALPGVEAVAIGSDLPLDYGSAGSIVIGASTGRAADEPYARVRLVAPSYFAALGIPLRQGRAFAPSDTADVGGVIVNETFARQYASRGGRVGGTLGWDPAHQRPIVGVVGDVRLALDEEPVPMVYFAMAPGSLSSIRVAIRARNDPAALTTAVRGAIASVDPSLVVASPRSMRQLLDTSRSVFLRRFPLLVMSVFSSIGILLAAVGLFGVVAYSVASRGREFGIRMALGASRASVVRLSIREALGAAIGGIAAGLVLALLAGRALAALLYGIAPVDPASVAITIGVIVLTGLAAAAIPARRAVSIPPSLAMRDGG